MWNWYRGLAFLVCHDLIVVDMVKELCAKVIVETNLCFLGVGFLNLPMYMYVNLGDAFERRVHVLYIHMYRYACTFQV